MSGVVSSSVLLKIVPFRSLCLHHYGVKYCGDNVFFPGFTEVTRFAVGDNRIISEARAGYEKYFPCSRKKSESEKKKDNNFTYGTA